MFALQPSSKALCHKAVYCYFASLPIGKRRLVASSSFSTPKITLFDPVKQEQLAQLNTEIAAHYKNAELSKAFEKAERSCEISEEIFGQHHPNFATAVSNLALIVKEKGDLNESVYLYEKALQIYDDAKIETSARLIVLQNLAQVCRMIANSLKIWKEAEKRNYLTKSKNYLEDVIKKVKANNITNDASLNVPDLQRKIANVRSERPRKEANELLLIAYIGLEGYGRV